jgi:hypothetical protein
MLPTTTCCGFEVDLNGIHTQFLVGKYTKFIQFKLKYMKIKPTYIYIYKGVLKDTQD